MPLPLTQQSLSDKGFKKAQTLTYLNGYQREQSIPVVGELEGTASPTAGSPAATLAAAKTGVTLSPTMMRADSPSQLPSWVANDRKVCTQRQ